MGTRLGLDVAEDIASSYAALARARVQLLAAVEDLPGLTREQERESAAESPYTRALTHVIQSEWHYAMAQQCLRGAAGRIASPGGDGGTVVAPGTAAAAIRERLLAALCDATEDEIGRVVAGASERPGERRRRPERALGGPTAGWPISFP